MPWVEESLDEEFRKCILDFPEIQLPKIYLLLEQYGKGKEIVIFRSRDEADMYLDSLNSK